MKRRAVLVVLVAVVVSGGACLARIVSMPGTSWAGAPGLAEPALEQALRADVEALAGRIGERNLVNAPQRLDEAARFVAQRLASLGYAVQEEPFAVEGRTVRNLIAERRGASRPSELIVVGAHYDTAPGTPGADDNASGVAVGLALAAQFSTRTPARTLRFVFFTNEEPPFFNTPDMGSEVNAAAARARGDDVRAMLALETMGYFVDDADSQHYPWPFSWAYPSTGDFVAFVGDSASRALLHEVITTFREKTPLASEGAALPRFVQGADWSDHGPYWRQGYGALMVTDTAPFRNPHYHEASDTPERLDYRRLALATSGLVHVVAALAGEGTQAP
jgi:hypothetical protein